MVLLTSACKDVQGGATCWGMHGTGIAEGGAEDDTASWALFAAVTEVICALWSGNGGVTWWLHALKALVKTVAEDIESVLCLGKPRILVKKRRE